MNLHRLLLARKAAGMPVTVGLVGAGKFGSMFLAQARLTDGLQVAGLADLYPDRARERLAICGWPSEQAAARSLDQALKTGATFVTEDAMALVRHPGLEVIIEATGDPATGIRLCLATIEHGKHIVMVNVEADALAGPLLARKAKEKGVVYSLAWGDQPALVCEHVDWARACGFKVVAAGKGTRYHPSYHRSTPDTVWDILAKYLRIEQRSLINPKIFNSFIDGTKSGIEMTAVCNATGLVPQTHGLGFPPASRFELADVCKPKADGGALDKAGVTEVVSSVTREENDVPHHIAMGTYVVFEGETDYARRCFAEYHLLPDSSGRYAALYRPIHMIGLELGVSVASAALRKEPTGAPVCFNSDVVATAKRPLKAGEVLDGEGGFCVWGRQQPAAMSVKAGCLPLGLAHNVKLRRDIAEGQMLAWADVEIDETDIAVKIRREMEKAFASAGQAASSP
ncbi:MAG: flagellar biosynthesis protein FlgA [Hyphomicrobiaceae bacterium]|nr:MAG: flagellar biosynthesis protein FlgA [Hyphomicrobiaceae bacterium]